MSAPKLVDVLLAELDDAALDVLAERLAPRLARSLGQSPWLNAADAARYLACSRDRLYDLVGVGKLKPRRDGRRLLFSRSDLDAYVDVAG